ncbi:hypothetical protein ACSMDF_17170 [Yersinia enterocolitica]|jgi:hypothetical protein|uniref:CdiI immunity protein domain-containing protein n=1 Tax=Yersinia massiliensis TaxID=419257 RepID=A0ABM6UPM7_9GAMM|nr:MULTISPECIES: hypothetical protein [Yersinia]AVX36789.1 hypothetical protein DA391_03390 [Yersinia massiliensis]QKJ11590.1 hypothetical protein HRD68_13165 [Yersinia massiliensis]CFR30552.1 Uncharacterised protein [Yersinia frederiksenii]
MSYERILYQEIRSSFLECYYYCCRNILDNVGRGGDGWAEGEHEIGYAYYQFENAYELPIENLMLNVLNLILGAGRFGDTFDSFYRREISEILSKHSLDDLMADIDEEERKDLLYDMKLLKLV